MKRWVQKARNGVLYLPSPLLSALKQLHLLMCFWSKPVFLARGALTVLHREGLFHGVRIADCALCTQGVSVYQVYLLCVYTSVHRNARTHLKSLVPAQPCVGPIRLPFLDRCGGGPSMLAGPIETWLRITFFEQSISFF